MLSLGLLLRLSGALSLEAKPQMTEELTSKGERHKRSILASCTRVNRSNGSMDFGFVSPEPYISFESERLV